MTKPFKLSDYDKSRLRQFGMTVEDEEFFCSAQPQVKYQASSEDWLAGFQAGRCSYWGYNAKKADEAADDTWRVIAACLDGEHGEVMDFDRLRTMYPTPSRNELLARIREMANSRDG